MTAQLDEAQLILPKQARPSQRGVSVQGRDRPGVGPRASFSFCGVGLRGQVLLFLSGYAHAKGQQQP